MESERPFLNDPVDLKRLTTRQWESLCDGCARCCLHKLQDVETGKIVTTRVACRLLDRTRCRCRDYPRRHRHVPECVRLSAGNVLTIAWLPASCAYRRLAEGRPLARWHPMLSGDPASVHRAGVSVRGFALPEKDVHPDDWLALMIDWKKMPA